MIQFLLAFIAIFVNLFILRYLRGLEAKDCECSTNHVVDSEANYIKWYALISIGVIGLYYIIPFLLTLGIFLLKPKNNKTIVAKLSSGFSKMLLSPSAMFIFEVYLIAGLINIYLIYRLTKNIKKSKCACTDTIERKSLYYYSIGVIVIYIIAFLVSIEMKLSGH